MSNYNDRILEWAVGDKKNVIRTVGGLPLGITVTEAWLHFKTDDDVADADATVTRHITGVATSEGVILDQDANDGVAVLRFVCSAADSVVLGGEVPYRFYIRIALSDGTPNTPFIGTTQLVK